MNSKDANFVISLCSESYHQVSRWIEQDDFESLISNIDDIKKLKKYEQTLLCLMAADEKKLDILKTIITHMHRADDGFIISFLSKNDLGEAIEFFIENIDVDIKEKNVALCGIVKNGDLNLVKLLQENIFKNLDKGLITYTKKLNPITCAAKTNNLDIFKYLIQYNYYDLNDAITYIVLLKNFEMFKLTYPYISDEKMIQVLSTLASGSSNRDEMIDFLFERLDDQLLDRAMEHITEYQIKNDNNCNAYFYMKEQSRQTKKMLESKLDSEQNKKHYIKKI